MTVMNDKVTMGKVVADYQDDKRMRNDDDNGLRHQKRMWKREEKEHNNGYGNQGR